MTIKSLCNPIHFLLEKRVALKPKITSFKSSICIGRWLAILALLKLMWNDEMVLFEFCDSIRASREYFGFICIAFVLKTQWICPADILTATILVHLAEWEEMNKKANTKNQFLNSNSFSLNKNVSFILFHVEHSMFLESYFNGFEISNHIN